MFASLDPPPNYQGVIAAPAPCIFTELAFIYSFTPPCQSALPSSVNSEAALCAEAPQNGSVYILETKNRLKIMSWGWTL